MLRIVYEINSRDAKIARFWPEEQNEELCVFGRRNRTRHTLSSPKLENV
jgi:hypothetical protein